MFVVISAIVLIIAACGGGGGAGATAGDMLARIKKDGVIRVGTDPNYAPQSFQKSDGTFDGFDVAVANEIAKRLGVTAKFETPDFSVVEAGNWADRFDISVGSMTITEKRKGVLDFTEPYYYTPAQMAAIKDIGITTLDGLAGKKVCVGEATTYYEWLTGTLKLGDGSALAPVPAGAEAFDPEDRPGLRSVGQVRPSGRRWLAELVDDCPAGHRRRHADRHGRRPGLLRAARGGHGQGGAAARRAASGARPGSSRRCTPTARSPRSASSGSTVRT